MEDIDEDMFDGDKKYKIHPCVCWDQGSFPV